MCTTCLNDCNLRVHGCDYLLRTGCDVVPDIGELVCGEVNLFVTIPDSAWPPTLPVRHKYADVSPDIILLCKFAPKLEWLYEIHWMVQPPGINRNPS